MVKYLVFLISIIFFGCEMNNNQIIKPEKYEFEIIKFDTVSKELIYTSEFASSDHKKFKNLIQYWFDNRIKTNGFDGDLIVNVQRIDFEREKSSDYFKFSALLTIEFIEYKKDNKKNSHILNSRDYGEIKGNFSIKDQENLEINIMHKAIDSISVKFNELN